MGDANIALHPIGVGGGGLKPNVLKPPSEGGEG